MALLIAVEGHDGCGKTSLVTKLVEALAKDPAFYPWVYGTKEPGSMWAAPCQDIRKMVLETPDFRPFERELLFYVDASLHKRFIESQKNAIIISDRGLWSHYAYLRGYLKTKQIDWDDYSLCKEVIGKVCAEPDCVVYLKGDLSLMKERLAGKEKDAIEKNGEAFFSAVLETYEDLVAEREWEGKPHLTLSAVDNIDNNVTKVIDYLKEVFSYDQLSQGSREVC